MKRRWPGIDRLRTWQRLALLAVGVAVVTTTILLLVEDVFRKVDALATAGSDTSIWTLSQVEVEFRRLEIALLSADGSDPMELAELRRRFDIFYSRVETVNSSPVFSGLRETSEFAAALNEALDFLDRSVPAIDADDTVLAAALPDLIAQSGIVSPSIRFLGLGGISSYAQLSDNQRAGLRDTLVRIGTAAIIFFAALVLALFLVSRLLRERGAQARAAAATSSRLGAVVSTSQDAILVTDHNGVLLDYNGAAEDIFGYSRYEAIGQNVADLVIPAHLRARHEKAMDLFRRTGKAHIVGTGRVQLEAKRKGGGLFPVELSINTALSQDGTVFVSYIRDISTRLAAESALMEARDKALAGEQAKADLLAVMSHEMRTPLNGMLGTMELMSLTVSDEEQAAHLRAMQTSGDLLLGHVNDVLGIASLDSGKTTLSLSSFSVPDLIEDIVNSMSGVLAKAHNNLVVDAILPDLEIVEGDARRVRQVLINLLGNAVKFTRNGTITLRAFRDGGGDIVVFEVCDTGLGIDATEHDRIFDDFVTIDTTYGREAEGTGLGLSITRRLVDIMDGEITVDSHLGKGSTFSVALPLPAALVTKPASKADVDTHEDMKQDSALRVLVVEDNAINQRVVQGMLSRLGCEIEQASNGCDGVQKARETAFDVILMDISMPVLDGLEATEQIRSLPGASQHARILALTAHALPAERDRFLTSGLDGVVTKPVSLRDLQRALAGGSPEQPGPELQHLVNPTYVKDLQDVLGSAAVLEAIEGFSVQFEGALEKMDAAEQAGDFDSLVKESHELAGTSALIGAAALSRELIKIERVSEKNNQKDLPKRLANLRKSWAEAEIALKGQIAPEPSDLAR